MFDFCFTKSIDEDETPASARHVAIISAATIQRGGEELIYIQRSLGFLCENLEGELEKLRLYAIELEDLADALQIGKLIAVNTKRSIFLKVLEEAKANSKCVDLYITENPHLIHGCRVGEAI